MMFIFSILLLNTCCNISNSCPDKTYLMYSIVTYTIYYPKLFRTFEEPDRVDVNNGGHLNVNLLHIFKQLYKVLFLSFFCRLTSV